MSIASLIHYLLPYASGSPTSGFEDLPARLGLEGMQNFNEQTGYVGGVTLFLALCCVCWRREGLTRFYAATAAVSLLLILGMPPFPAVLQMLPVLNAMNHTRLLLLVGFALAVLAGLGLDTLVNLEHNRKQVWLVALFLGLVSAVLVFAFAVLEPRLSSLEPAYKAFLLCQLPMLAGGMFVALLAGLRLNPFPPAAIGWLCVGWTALDLLLFAGGYNPTISRDLYYPQPEVVKFLKHDVSHFRILGAGDILPANTASIYEVDDARGCDFMAVRRYEELVTGQAGVFYFYSLASYIPQALPLLNVKYILATTRTPMDPARFELVYSNQVAVYRYKQCLDRALAVFNYKVCPPQEMLKTVRDARFDPRQTLLLEEEPDRQETAPANSAATSGNSECRITSYQPDSVSIQASLSQPGFLLLLDTWFPGWNVTVNGRPAKVYRADYNFRAVSLPAGSSAVNFTYHPASFTIGCALFLVSLLLLILAFFKKATPPERGLQTCARTGSAVCF